MNTGNRPDLCSTIANRLQDLDDVVERRCCCREQNRCCATARVEIANGSKRFCRCFHRVAADRAVYMKIDKTRRQIISIEINELFSAYPLACPPWPRRRRTDRGDFSFFHNNFKPLADSIWENQTRVREDHLVM